MKHKLLSILLCLAMALSLLPTAALAEGDTTGTTGPTITTSEELVAAIKNAQDGDTITLGEGEFTTYGNASPKKSLTFVGSGPSTVWKIGNLDSNLGGESNGDYSFDGCDTITFKNMTLKSDSANYRGFIRINKTVVDNCTIDGKTAYWGYNTAKFQNGTIFNAPEDDYALWDYSSKSMTFDNCTFNISGKGVNVYVEAGNAGSDARTVTVKDCTVNSTKENKAFLNIKNSTQAYEVEITGNNEVTGLSADTTTGSNLYQVETSTITENFGKPVKIQERAADGTLTTVYEVKAPAVAEVGGIGYTTLEEALAALNGTNHTLTLIDENAWTYDNVYWKAGTESGSAATLKAAMEAAYAEDAGSITIICKPNATIAKSDAHIDVTGDITVYANGADFGGNDLSIGTYKAPKTSETTINIYDARNLVVWGQPVGDRADVWNVNFTDCVNDGWNFLMYRGETGKATINATLTGCKATGFNDSIIHTTADGSIAIKNCEFANNCAPVNIAHKQTGTMTVTVENSTFTNCGSTSETNNLNQYAAPVRIVNNNETGTVAAAVTNCTFAGTVGNNGDILIGDGRTGKTSNDVALTVSGTDASVQAQKPGYYNGESTDDTKKGSKNVAASDTFTSSIEEMISKGMADYVTVGGIKGFEDKKFASFTDAYEAIKPELEKLCENDALGEGAATAEKFDALFTDRDANGNATLTYTIVGNVTYDETSLDHLLTMGRKASHYGNDRHLINFKFVGGSNDKTKDTLTVNSDITLPYEWWGEKTTTSISFENLTITGSAPNGLYTYQHFFEGIDFKVDNCTLRGIKIYNCANVGGSYTITDSTLDGTGAAANAYAIHLQGNETAPLTINISGNTISGYDRGINIDQKTANATISRNKISVNDTNRSCIQLTQLATTTVSGNTLNLTGGNALTFHSQLAESSKINFTGNTVNGTGYLIYDDTKNPIELTYSSNTVASTVDTTKGIYNGITKELTKDVDAVINPAPDYSGGGSSDPTYSVSTPSKTENGTVTVSPKSASKGDTVTITVEPDEGYVLDELTVTDSKGEKVELTKVSDTKYTFTMPRSQVTIEATFVEDPDYVEPDPSTSVADIFDDIQPGAWYEDAVQFAYDEGIMTGTSKTTFEPNTTTTRGMIVSILHRLEGNPVVTEEAFSDVSADDWYGKAVAWASSEGIVGGYGDGTFQPNKAITREEMASILYRYAQYKDQDVSARADLTKYTDADQVGAWAEEVMQWANAEGLINGMTEDTLVPQGNATRAQVAAMFQRYLNK